MSVCGVVLKDEKAAFLDAVTTESEFPKNQNAARGDDLPCLSRNATERPQVLLHLGLEKADRFVKGEAKKDRADSNRRISFNQPDGPFQTRRGRMPCDTQKRSLWKWRDLRM
jgi:hypothetical protein